MRVIAVESFTDDAGDFHPYGQEFTMADTPERAELLQAGTIREDDRFRRAPEPSADGG
jgi:hypothetical protein